MVEPRLTDFARWDRLRCSWVEFGEAKHDEKEAP